MKEKAVYVPHRHPGGQGEVSLGPVREHRISTVM